MIHCHLLCKLFAWVKYFTSFGWLRCHCFQLSWSEFSFFWFYLSAVTIYILLNHVRIMLKRISKLVILCMIKSSWVRWWQERLLERCCYSLLVVLSRLSVYSHTQVWNRMIFINAICGCMNLNAVASTMLFLYRASLIFGLLAINLHLTLNKLLRSSA